MKKIKILALILSLTGYLSADSLQLNDIFNLASQHNPDLIEARLAVKQKVYNKKIRSSQFLPQISGNSSISKDQSERYSIQASQLLFDGFKTFHEVKEAELNIVVSQEDLSLTEARIRYQVTMAYLNTLRNKQLISLTQSIRKTRENSYKLVKLRYDAGQENQGAMLKAKANLSNSRFELKKTLRNKALLRQSLERSIGKTLNDKDRIQGNIASLPQLNTLKDFQKAAENTATIRKLSYQKKASEAALKAINASSLPQLSGNASYHYNPSAVINKEDTSYGASLRLPLLDGGLKKNQKAVSKNNVLILKKKLEKNILEKSIKLEELYIDAQNKRDYIAVSKEFLSASRMRFKISSAQYSTGRISFTNWQLIENELINAEISYLNALFAAQQAIAIYFLELGRGLND